jgi:hypothetical protein
MPSMYPVRSVTVQVFGNQSKQKPYGPPAIGSHYLLIPTKLVRALSVAKGDQYMVFDMGDGSILFKPFGMMDHRLAPGSVAAKAEEDEVAAARMAEGLSSDQQAELVKAEKFRKNIGWSYGQHIGNWEKMSEELDRIPESGVGDFFKQSDGSE